MTRLINKQIIHWVNKHECRFLLALRVVGTSLEKLLPLCNNSASEASPTNESSENNFSCQVDTIVTYVPDDPLPYTPENSLIQLMIFTRTNTIWVQTLGSVRSPRTYVCIAGICSFVRFCGDLLTPELTRRLMLPLDSALAMLSG